jgi:hypothetical protein
MKRPQHAKLAGLVVLCVLGPLCAAQVAFGQLGAAPAGPPLPAKKAALIDVTGYWASIISVDWRWRMMTAPVGDFSSVPLNPEGIRVTRAWDPKADEAQGAQCKAYGAAGLMRLPEELLIQWTDDNTLQIQTDTGMQVRQLHFGGHWSAGEPTAQGYSTAAWYKQTQTVGFNPPSNGPKPGGGGSLKVMTTHMLAGYLRRNGVPYSADASMTEYLDRIDDEGTSYLIVTSVVEDPVYLRDIFITTEEFMKMPDGSHWDPQPCRIIPPTSTSQVLG